MIQKDSLEEGSTFKFRDETRRKSRCDQQHFQLIFCHKSINFRCR